jgi:hypothetical protein
MTTISNGETQKIQAYLQRRFGNGGITLRPRAQTNDSVEVLLNGEFIGVVYKDDEEDDISYDFNMAILAADLPA